MTALEMAGRNQCHKRTGPIHYSGLDVSSQCFYCLDETGVCQSTETDDVITMCTQMDDVIQYDDLLCLQPCHTVVININSRNLTISAHNVPTAPRVVFADQQKLLTS